MQKLKHFANETIQPRGASFASLTAKFPHALVSWTLASKMLMIIMSTINNVNNRTC